jgi:hypothetical protein
MLDRVNKIVGGLQETNKVKRAVNFLKWRASLQLPASLRQNGNGWHYLKVPIASSLFMSRFRDDVHETQSRA